MLGRAVHKALLMSLATQASVIGTAHSRTQGGLIPCDVTDEASLREFLAAQAPRVVINCVAERRPDVVEREPGRAQELNVRLVEILAEESARLGFYLVHISTDYVFDGTSPPYKPEDPPNPLNMYGEHKLAGEEVLRRGHGGVQVRLWGSRREEGE
jgi:dTDP-4-dehydrorhamnose reductase